MSGGKLAIFRAILRFMQDNDRNGDWLTASVDEAPYVLKTIREWTTEHALEVTPRVRGYIEFLEELI